MDIRWKPHAGPQEIFCSAWQDEVLFGGAAGPGKTDCLIMEATRFVDRSNHKGIILRRTFPQMQEILDRTREYYPLLGGEYKATEHRWYFPSGKTINLGHMSDEGSEYNYQGQEYADIFFDEAGQFLPKQLAYLFSRCRSKDSDIPKRIRYASNPGGPAHAFLKDRFRIGLVKAGTTFYDDIKVGLPNGTIIEQKLSRVFIPARLSDNPTLIQHDPVYVARLMQLPEIERLRLMEGSWDAFEGQKFQELNQEVHGYEDDLPREWECFGAFDWGYARPWAYGLFRVDYDGRVYLDALHYAVKPNMENVGMRQTDSEIARTIRQMETDYGMRPRWRVAGPDIWNPKRNKDGVMGPSPSDNMSMEGVTFIKADNNRIQGWQQIHHRLKVDDDGQPWFYARRSLEHFWRTMADLQEDPRNPEDITGCGHKDIEDHIPELVRYALMTRPMKPKRVPTPDVGSFQYERRKFIRAKRFAARKGISIDQAYRLRLF